MTTTIKRLDHSTVVVLSIVVSLVLTSLVLVALAATMAEPEPRNWMEQVAMEECGDLVADGPIRVLKEAGWATDHVQDIWVFEQTDGTEVHVYARPTPGNPVGVQDGFDCTPEIP